MLRSKPLRFDLLEKGDTVVSEREIICFNGTTKWIEMHSKKMPDGTYHSFIRDISDKRRDTIALLESENKYKSIISISNTGAWEYDYDTKFLWCSPEYFSMLGYNPEEINVDEISNIDKAWVDLLHPDDKVSATEHFKDYLEIKYEDLYESFFRMKHKDGIYRWIWSRGKTLRDEYGKVTNITVGTHIDITNQKLFEEEIKKSEKRAKKQRQGISNLIIEQKNLNEDIETALKIITKTLSETINVSRASIWALSLDENELECINLYESDKSEYSKGVTLKTEDYPEYFKAIMTKSRISVPDAQNDKRTMEFTEGYLKPLGITSILDAGIISEGKLWGIICCEHIGEKRNWYSDEESFISTIASLTAQLFINYDKKQTELALQESQNKFSALFSKMTEMVVLHEVIFDKNEQAIDYKILDCNDSFTKVTGIKKELVIDKLASEVYEQYPAPYLKEFSEVGITGISKEIKEYYEPMDKHFNISIVSHQKNHFATITTDTSSLEKYNKMLVQKNKELENYLYIASHDLRSPLVNIQGFSDRLKKQTEQICNLLVECKNDNPFKERISEITNKIPGTLDYIFNNVSKMDNLINGLLKISRTGKMPMDIKNIDVKNIIENVIISYDYQLKENEAIIIIDEIPSCYGDESLLNQMFSNIIGNSIKYRNNNNNLTIKISGKKQYKKNIYTIEDNGIGIVNKNIERIWDVFFRENRVEDKDGEGLGLSIVKRIIDKHKGNIIVSSKENEGTIFHIELPNEQFHE